MVFEKYEDVIDAFERDNMGYETLTDYIKGENIRIMEIEMTPLDDLKKTFSGADGGSVGIEILFGPKRGEYQTGGPAYDSRATAEDFAQAISKVGGGTAAQKLQDIGRYTTGQLGLTQQHFDNIAAMKSDPKKFGINKQIDYAKLSGKDLVKGANPALQPFVALGQGLASPIYDYYQALQNYSDKGYQGDFELSKKGILDFGKNLLRVGEEFAAQKPVQMAAGRTLGGLEAIQEGLSQFGTAAASTPSQLTSKPSQTFTADSEGYAAYQGIVPGFKAKKRSDGRFEYKAPDGQIYGPDTYTDIAVGKYPNIYDPNKQKKADGGQVGSTMKSKRGLVDEPGGYAGLTEQQEALLGLQLQNDPEYQTGFYKSSPELKFEDFYKAPVGPLRYVDEVQGSDSYFDEDLEKYNVGPAGPLRDIDKDRTAGILQALDAKDPSGELAFDYMDRLKPTEDGGYYETIQTNKPKFSEFQLIPENQIKIAPPKNFQNLTSTPKSVYGYTTLDVPSSEYGTKFMNQSNPIYLSENLAKYITTKPMSPANQKLIFDTGVPGMFGATPAELMSKAVDTVQHEYAHNITKFPAFADVIKNAMNAPTPKDFQLKGKPGDDLSKFDKEELFTRALDIERLRRKEGDLNNPSIDLDLDYMNSVLSKKYKNLNNQGQSLAIQYINSLRPQVNDYFNTIDKLNVLGRDKDRGGFDPSGPTQASIRATREDRSGRGQKGGFTNPGKGSYGPFMADGGRVGLFMGGPPLEGQALSIYDSMKAYGFSDEEIADALRARGLYDVAPVVETPVINTVPNIINQKGDGPSQPPGGFDLGYSSENFGLGPNEDVVDYEAEAYKIGPTFRGQFAKSKIGFRDLISKMRSLPTPLNIALNLAGKVGDFFNSQTNNATKQAIARESVRDLQDRIDRGEFGSPTPTPQDIARGGYSGSKGSGGKGGKGKGGGDNPYGGGPGGLHAKDGGLATMFKRKR